MEIGIGPVVAVVRRCHRSKAGDTLPAHASEVVRGSRSFKNSSPVRTRRVTDVAQMLRRNSDTRLKPTVSKQDKAQRNGGGKWAQSSQDWMTSEEGREGGRDGEEWWEGERETGSGKSWRRRRLEVKVGEQPIYPHAFHRILLQVVRIILQKNIIQSVRGSPLISLCNQLFDGLFLRRITVGEQLHLSGVCEGDDFCKWPGEIRQLVCSKPC